MTNYVFLGTGTTDSTGKAKLDHDANGDAIDHSYTGTGAGEIDVVASLDKPIASGSVVSQPCEVLDCIVKDDGVTGGDNDSNVLGLSACSKEVQSDGTLITATNQNNPTINFRNSSDIYIYPKTGFEVVFDVVSMDSALTCYVADNGAYKSLTINKSFAVGHTVKIRYDGSKVKIWYDTTGSSEESLALTGNARVYLRKVGNNQSFSMKIKNVRGYPI